MNNNINNNNNNMNNIYQLQTTIILVYYLKDLQIKLSVTNNLINFLLLITKMILNIYQI